MVNIKVLVADDQALVRGALVALLNLESDLEVVAEADNGESAVALAAERHVDVCVLDIQMPGVNGIEAARRIHDGVPGCRSLMVTTFGRTGYLREALQAGASGFVVKDTPASELAEAIRKVHAGLRVVDPELAAASLSEGENPLTFREREVLSLARDGKAVAAISAVLHLSAGTVRNHLSAAIGKTGAVNRIEAAGIAAERGWL
ncbi:response regulator transcription factor [Arthrobacter rhombi]|uniref:response regulator transcription factor n=1 Tax=Arthrobacter rhombi TaxID=71253 RepID=UPI0031D1F762